MAKIETFSMFQSKLPEHQIEIINVSASVGKNGVNHLEDVMVVQALLKHTLEYQKDFITDDFPEPHGGFPKQTTNLIKKFQKWYNKRSRIQVLVDGRISPAKSTPYVFGMRKWWTIYALNSAAFELALLTTYDKAAVEICNRWSFLRPILFKNGA